MDLTRLAAVALAAALASPMARAQPAVQSAPLQDPSLTTLLQPQKLDRSRPLLRSDREGAGSPDAAANRATPCVRQGGAPATGAAGARPGSTPSAFGGGSGPGDYGRYLPNAAAPSSTAAAGTRPAASPTRNAGVDRPLYGGTDRPLWDTGDRRSPPNTAAKPDAGKPAQPSEATQAGGASASTAPAPPRDRPLWADGSLMASTDPSAGAGTTPCVDPVPATPR